jgi:hypothetical protein
LGISCIEEVRSGQKPGRERPHGIPRHKWEDSIKMDLKLSFMFGLDSFGSG